MHPWTRSTLITGCLLTTLSAGCAPPSTQTLNPSTIAGDMALNHAKQASQEELDAFARRKRLSPADRQAEAEYQARQQAQQTQQEKDRQAAIEERQRQTPSPAAPSARVTIRTLRENAHQQSSAPYTTTAPRHTWPAQQPSEDPIQIVTNFCTVIGDVASLVPIARQKGLTPAETVQWFDTIAPQEARPLLYRIVTQTLILPGRPTPEQAKDLLTTQCLANPKFWAEVSATEVSGSLRY